MFSLLPFFVLAKVLTTLGCVTTSVLTRRQSGGDATPASGTCKSAEDSYING